MSGFDRISCVDAADGLRTLLDGCIPLTVTSPPYDGLRGYGGHDFGPEVFERVVQELWRVPVCGRQPQRKGGVRIHTLQEPPPVAQPAMMPENMAEDHIVSWS